MRDQTAVTVDHISMAVVADLDARNHVPDELEVDLGDADAVLAPRPGQRDRHIRLGLAAEIDRTVIDLVRHGLGEFRLVRVVDAAADHVHGEPRDFELLVTGGVDLRQLGNGGHLAQQPQRIEPALIQRAVGPRQLRGPAELALDLGDEFLDLVGGGFRLLMLDIDQRRFLLLKGKPDFEGAIGDQRQHHHTDEQRHIFDEKPAAHDRRAGCRRGGGEPIRRPAWSHAGPMVNVRLHRVILAEFPSTRLPFHSMTSSARASTVCGISRPIAFAVLRLTKS